MKVLFENQKFTTDAYGGIVRYFTELMRHFDKMDDIEYDMPIMFSNNAYLPELPRFKNKIRKAVSFRQFLWGLQFRGKGRVHQLFSNFTVGYINRYLTKKAMQKGNYDLLHPTYYSSYFLPELNGKPFVLTVYDMIHEIFMPHNTHIDPTIAQKKKIIPLATRLIAISQSAKNDLVKILNVDPDKVDVVYLGNSLFPDKNDLAVRPAQAPEKYLLFVGTRGGYKNFLAFTKSVAPLLREQSNLHLVCIGQAQFNNEEKSLFEKEQITNKLHQFTVDDKTLTQFYAHAEAFVFPSRYEGFGIPVLEAFACGCPAIISNVSSLPEVGGQAVAYFNPDSETNMYETIKNVLSSTDARNKLIADGYEQLKLFSWQKTAEETKKVYERALIDHKNQQAA